jgi:hypothetical protein
MDRERYEMEAATLIGERIAALRGLTFDRARELPEAEGEETLVGGRKCMLTTFRQVLRPDEILVTVQLARPAFLGLGSAHMEQGLVFKRGSVRDASREELVASNG